MYAMRWVIVSLLGLSLLGNDMAFAIETTPPPVEYYAPVTVNAFQTTRTETGEQNALLQTDVLDFFELYNHTQGPILLDNWSVVSSDAFGDICIVPLSGWILSESYVAAASDKAGVEDAAGHLRVYGNCEQEGRIITTIELRSNERMEEVITPVAPGGYVRKGLTKTYRSGNFTKDFTTMLAANRTSLYAGVWYEPATSTSLRIVELLPRARECAPNEVAYDCRDYVKLQNISTDDALLDGLRVRIGYQGQTATASNTVVLAGAVAAEGYVVIDQKDDGMPLSVINGASHVWLEDTYGIKRYDETIVSYPSAESDTKVGWAWAFDGQDTTWKWTTTATPYGQPSTFTLPEPEVTVKKVSQEPKPCLKGQYRNPLTNRCKALTTSSSLSACAAGQVRNPATNRCRSLTATTSKSLSPCEPGQYRNPATNRCKAIASATASSLKPCAEGQERNPATNRCRTIVRNIAADFPVETITQTGGAAMSWWAFGGAGMLAVAYAGWEWRREVRMAIAKVTHFVVSRR